VTQDRVNICHSLSILYPKSRRRRRRRRRKEKPISLKSVVESQSLRYFDLCAVVVALAGWTMYIRAKRLRAETSASQARRLLDRF
jgi:hypothetical protein